MPFSERGPFGNSDNPITKPKTEWAPEAKSLDLSPEDQAALRELLRHWEQANKTNNLEKADEAADEISKLIGRPVDDADLFELKEALNEPADDDLFGFEGESDKWDRKTVEETLKPTKISGEENSSELAGREKIRRGDYFPEKISGKRAHGLKTSKSKITNLDQKRDSKVSKGTKPMWKGRRTQKIRAAQKRKSKLAA